MAATAEQPGTQATWGHQSPYDRYLDSLGLPVYRAHHIEDLRSIELGWWEKRKCNSAFLQLAGQEDIQEARVTEIPPGTTLPPTRIALEEVVYALEGRGLTSIWGADGLPRKSFEWQKHSIFMVPPNYSYQLSNVQGNQPARVLQLNYLPLALLCVPDLDFFLDNPKVDLGLVYGDGADDLYSEAKVTHPSDRNRSGLRNLWVGNFFPDMKAWDKLEPYRTRGAGGHTVYFRSTMSRGGHMSVFPARTYKMAHRHGPGRVIVIPAGEGYSIIWQEGGEKIVLPWHEGSVFTPPNQWYHQHFNLGADPARYIAFGPPNVLAGRDEDDPKRQLAYAYEEPWIRQKFEEELAKRGLTSLMPDECYRDPSYQWTYGEDQA